MKQNLKARIITGAILLSALAFAIIMGGWVFSVICILCIGIALYEMMHALRQRGHQIVRWPVWAATIASIPCFLMWQNRLLLPIAVFTCMVTTAYVLFHGEPKLEDILLSLMPFFAVSLPGMCLLAQINAPFRWLRWAIPRRILSAAALASASSFLLSAPIKRWPARWRG